MISRSELHPYIADKPDGLLRIFGVLLFIFFPLLVLITSIYNFLCVLVDYTVNDVFPDVVDTWEDIKDFIKGDICV
jgi:hypothetical protein